MTKHAIAEFVSRLQWWAILFILYFSTIAFAGYRTSLVFLIRLFVLFGFATEVVLWLAKSSYFKSFPRVVFLPALVFISFLVFVFFQYLFGTRLLEGSILGSIYQHATFDSFIQLVVYFIFFVLCLGHVSERKDIERLGSSLALLAFVITVLGITQRSVSERILWKSYSSFPWRFFGPFVNENHFGGFLALTFPLALGLMHYRFNEVKREISQDREQKALWKNWLLFIDRGVVFLFLLVILTLGTCFFSLARVSSFVLLFCCIGYFVAYGINRRNLKFFLTLISVLIGSFLLLQWLGFESLTSYFSKESLWTAWIQRYRAAKESLALFHSYPLFGTGLGTYPYISSKVVSLLNYVFWNHVHNDYVELLTDTGIFGFSLWMGAIAGLVFASWRQSKRNPSMWNRAMTSQASISILCIAVMETADYHLRVPANALLFTLQLALISAANRSAFGNRAHSHEEVQAAQSKHNWIFTIVCLVLAGFLSVVSLNAYRAARQAEKQGNRLEHLEKAVELVPSDAELWYQLGREYALRLKEEEEKKELSALTDEALRAFRNAVALSPTFAQGWYVLGSVEYSAGFRANGIESVKKAVYWAPARLRYSVYLLALYLREGQKTRNRVEREKFLGEARILYERLQRLETTPTQGEYRAWMGDYYYDRLTQLT